MHSCMMWIFKRVDKRMLLRRTIAHCAAHHIANKHLCKETYNRLIPLLLLLQLQMMIMRFNGNSWNYRIDTSLSCVYKTLFLRIKITQLYNLIDTIIMQNTCQYTIRYFEHLKLVWNSSSFQLTVISYLHWHIKDIFIK